MPYLESTADDALLSGLDHLDQGVLFIGPDLCVRVASKVLHSIYGFPDDIMVVGPVRSFLTKPKPGQRSQISQISSPQLQ